MNRLIVILFPWVVAVGSPQGLLDRIKNTLPKPTEEIGVQVVPRDAFPVFDHPEFVTAKTAESEGYVNDRDPVIGVIILGEAKAYPVSTMGIHELGNDSLGGVPIAVSW